MHVGALRVELRVPNVHSLKEKRHVLKNLIAGIEKKFPVSIAEVDFQNAWQRATLGIAVVAPQAGQLERLLHTIERELRNARDVEVLEVGVSYLEEQV